MKGHCTKGCQGTCGTRRARARTECVSVLVLSVGAASRMYRHRFARPDWVLVGGVVAAGCGTGSVLGCMHGPGQRWQGLGHPIPSAPFLTQIVWVWGVQLVAQGVGSLWTLTGVHAREVARLEGGGGGGEGGMEAGCHGVSLGSGATSFVRLLWG